jgi:hypothetical protein
VYDDEFTIRLTKDQAFVLSDWLHRMMGTPSFNNLVNEERAVWSPLYTIAGTLDKSLVEIFMPDYSGRALMPMGGRCSVSDSLIAGRRWCMAGSGRRLDDCGRRVRGNESGALARRCLKALRIRHADGSRRWLARCRTRDNAGSDSR